MSLGVGISGFMTSHPRARCNIRGPEHTDPVWRLNVTTSSGDVLNFDGPTLAGVIRFAEASMFGSASVWAAELEHERAEVHRHADEKAQHIADLEAIVLHADMPDGESWERAYNEVVGIARRAVERAVAQRKAAVG